MILCVRMFIYALQQVPAHIETGDKIVVNTTDNSYVSRLVENLVNNFSLVSHTYIWSFPWSCMCSLITFHILAISSFFDMYIYISLVYQDYCAWLTMGPNLISQGLNQKYRIQLDKWSSCEFSSVWKN